jgi:hypothetical protein
MTTHTTTEPNPTISRYRHWTQALVRRSLHPSPERARARDVVTVLGGFVIAVGLSTALLAVWASVAALVAGVLTVGALAP